MIIKYYKITYLVFGEAKEGFFERRNNKGLLKTFFMNSIQDYYNCKWSDIILTGPPEEITEEQYQAEISRKDA
jgi:hypothetical protein